jgi:fructose-bisphosphate aldolase class II
MNLKELIYSLKEDQAILHYNVSSLEQIKAGILAVKEIKKPLIFGVSEGERDYLNPKLVKKIIDFYKEEENLQDLIFLNADHSKSLESAKRAIDLNYDFVLIDLSELELEENIRQTKELVEYADLRRLDAETNNLPGFKRDDLPGLESDLSGKHPGNKSGKHPGNNTQYRSVLIEGEVGKIEGKSEIQKEVEVKKENLTKVEDALRFVEETKVDLLAVSIGNVHGIVEKEPELDFERGREIAKAVKIPLVLHGASGLSIEKIKKCISIGFKIIHINTEFRKIWKEKLKEELEKETVVPYKIYEPVIEEIKKKIIYYQEEFFLK